MPNSTVVLIVDDHEDSCLMYAHLLALMGFDPITARNAEDALRQAHALHPDVVITDLRLPGPSGLDLARRLRSADDTKNIGIILLTGSPCDPQRASEAGCDEVLMKPCLPDELATQIRRVSNARRDAAAAPVAQRPDARRLAVPV